MPRSRKKFISGRNKNCIFCHNTRSSICLILRQTVDRVESIGNYLDAGYIEIRQEVSGYTEIRQEGTGYIEIGQEGSGYIEIGQEG